MVRRNQSTIIKYQPDASKETEAETILASAYDLIFEEVEGEVIEGTKNEK